MKPDFAFVPDEDILHFTLTGFLPEGQTAKVCKLVLSALKAHNGQAYLQWQEVLTATEMSVLLPLLEWFPYYCPTDDLFAWFYNGRVNERILEKVRPHLRAAEEAGLLDQELRPCRAAISRLRLRLRPHGFDVASVMQSGYILKVDADG